MEKDTILDEVLNHRRVKKESSNEDSQMVLCQIKLFNLKILISTERL